MGDICAKKQGGQPAGKVGKVAEFESNLGKCVLVSAVLLCVV